MIKRIVSFISENYKSAYHCHAKGKSEQEKLYLRLLLVTDYICGMTDSYAKRLYQEDECNYIDRAMAVCRRFLVLFFCRGE